MAVDSSGNVYVADSETTTASKNLIAAAFLLPPGASAAPIRGNSTDLPPLPLTAAALFM